MSHDRKEGVYMSNDHQEMEIEPGVLVLGIVFAAMLLGLIFWLA